ncbi:MAG: hypothetical protein JWR55_3246 [Aeromicrobium sp.]|nr:hypothetical protein [Aeromicrobium sp.]
MTDTHETQTQPTRPDGTPSWRSHPARWIAGGAAAAALLAGGIGLGSAMADDEDDDRITGRNTVADSADTARDSDDAVADSGPAAASAPPTGYGAKDAATLSRVLTAATAEAEGAPSSLEAHRNGAWSVDLEQANGDETTVLIDADGSASVVRTERADADDANDPAPAGRLTQENLVALVDAAFAEAKGVVTEVDLGDNRAEVYSVQMLTAAGAETEIDLDGSFDVTQVDVERD